MDNYSSPNATNSFSILGDPIYRWELILAAVVTSLVSITGLTGNSLIIMAVVLSQKLQTSTNAFVTSLAIVDLLTSFFLILSIVTNQYVWSAESNPLFCVVDFIIRLFLLTSAYHLAAIGMNRLFYITKPFLYKKIFTSWKLAILVAMPSVISIGAIMIIVWMPLSEEFYNVTMCWRFQLFPEELEWVMPSLSVACAIPIAVIIMYCFIFTCKDTGNECRTSQNYH